MQPVTVLFSRSQPLLVSPRPSLPLTLLPLPLKCRETPSSLRYVYLDDAQNHRHISAVLQDPTTIQAPVELTPQVVSRVQKHCRFAISSLDYDDAEQAKKELRAALKLLGG